MPNKGLVSVSDVKTKLLSPATTSHFLLEVGFPRGTVGEELRTFLGVEQDTFLLQCCDTSLPGSSFATMNIDNDRTGVTETHAYRKVFDNRIDITFYVDSEYHLSIQFFELWMKFIAGEDLALNTKSQNFSSNNYNYRFRYPDEYIADSGFKITKIEKDFYSEVRTSNVLENIANIFTGSDFGDTKPIQTGHFLEYSFLRTFPLAINSMPVSYDTSQLLKVTVQMSYVKYKMNNLDGYNEGKGVNPFSFDFGDSPFGQAAVNTNLGLNTPPPPIVPRRGQGGLPLGTTTIRNGGVRTRGGTPVSNNRSSLRNRANRGAGLTNRGNRNPFNASPQNRNRNNRRGTGF
tara:strand:+ start:41 stop:1078 length:1038 start_codon:yes stop_codon:yes gene_type:complete